MCGLFARWTPGTPVPDVLAKTALSALAHRGPDGSGTYRGADGSLMFCHTRLAITGGDSGAQPFLCRDGTTAVMFGGEIYNHKELKRSLRHRYGDGDIPGTSDGCVVPALWAEEALAILVSRELDQNHKR